MAIENFIQQILNPPTPQSGVGSLRAERLQTPLGIGGQILKGAVAGGASKLFDFFRQTQIGKQAEEQVVQSTIGEFVTKNWPFLLAIGAILVLIVVKR